MSLSEILADHPARDTFDLDELDRAARAAMACASTSSPFANAPNTSIDFAAAAVSGGKLSHSATHADPSRASA